MIQPTPKKKGKTQRKRHITLAWVVLLVLINLATLAYVNYVHMYDTITKKAEQRGADRATVQILASLRATSTKSPLHSMLSRASVMSLSQPLTSQTLSPPPPPPQLPIFWINLDRSIDRRNKMESMFASTAKLARIDSWKHQRISAADTNHVTKMFERGVLTTSREVCSSHCDKWYRGRVLLKEVAVTVSHVYAITAAYQAGVEMALILEDDIVIEADFFTHWREYVSLAPSNWEVLQMLTNNKRVLSYLSRINNDAFVPWFPVHWSTGAYIINRKGMEKI